MPYDPREPNIVALEMTADEFIKAFEPWTDELRDAALREGWDIFECYGSDAGPIQVQCISDAAMASEETDLEVPQLDSDDDAMIIVMRGEGLHHQVARAIVLTHNPEDYRRMEYLANPEAFKEI